MTHARAEVAAWAARVLVAAGTPSSAAATVARHLVDAEASGHPSHGLGLLPLYLDDIAAGRIVPAAEPKVVRGRPAHLVVDGGSGFGHLAVELALERALRASRTEGACAVNVVRCTHVGRLGGYVEAIAQASAAALLCLGTIADAEDALVAPAGGRERMLGTNPIAFAAPSDPPLVVDLATSAVAYYELLRSARAGEGLPEGVLLDRAGEPTTRAEDVEEGTMLPFGGHKGAALALVAGVLGSLAADADAPSAGGVFALVLDASHDRARGALAAIARALERVRASAPAPSSAAVRLPGDASRARRAESERHGLAVPDELLADLGRRLGASLPPLGGD
jgi:hydroxycarboxylate dehydrogenase B